MAITKPKLPADLPEDFTLGQVISPDGADSGQPEQCGYNYLTRQVNDGQRALNTLAQELTEMNIDTRLTALESVTAGHDSRIETMWDALFSDIVTNPFLIGFANLDGVTVASGVWNQSAQRLEC